MEGMMVILAIVVIAICIAILWKYIPKFLQKNKQETTGVDEPVGIEAEQEDSEPIFCASCNKQILGKIKTIKGDTQHTKLCKRCYRSFMKGKMPRFEDVRT